MIKDQKLIEHINNIAIEGLLDMGVNVSIITPESWYLNWPLQETDAHFLVIRDRDLKRNKA